MLNSEKVWESMGNMKKYEKVWDNIRNGWVFKVENFKADTVFGH